MRFLEKVALAALIIMAWRDDRWQDKTDDMPPFEPKAEPKPKDKPKKS